MSRSFKVDLTGMRFGRLTVLEFVPNEKNVSYWKCECDCGKIKTVIGTHLTRGNIISCGCKRNERIIEYSTKHNLCHTRIYGIWCGLKERCFNVENKNFNDYGGRGIKICDEWLSDFKAFYDWAVQSGYTDELTIDRIDVNGNYEPSNCRWVSRAIQNRNKRKNVIVEYQGKEMCLSEVSEESKINRDTLYKRYQRGDRGERLFRPAKTK